MSNTSAAFEDDQITSLTETQEKVLAVLPILPSLLSAWGSAHIIYMFFTSTKSSGYRRIMLGLSCSDFVGSLVLIFQPFLLPQDSSQRVWSIGTDASCSTMGFFQQLIFMSVWYNGMLSLYFLLMVKFGVKDPIFRSKYEPWMHIVCIGYPLITSIAGAKIGLYHELQMSGGCWYVCGFVVCLFRATASSLFLIGSDLHVYRITDYPEGCGCVDDTEAVCCESSIYGWFFAGIPTVLSFLMILINNLIVYFHVQRTISGRVSIENSISHSRDPHLYRIKAVKAQCSLYVAAFFVTYVPSLTIRVMESMKFNPEDEADIFPLLILQALTLPIQGFLNCLIYVRPTYLRARQEFPNESWYWAFRRALHGDRIQPTDEHRASSLVHAPASHVVLSPATEKPSALAENSGVPRNSETSATGRPGIDMSFSSRRIFGEGKRNWGGHPSSSSELNTAEWSSPLQPERKIVDVRDGDPPVMPVRVVTEIDDDVHEDSSGSTYAKKNPLTGFLLSLRTKKNPRKNDSQYVSSLAGSEFDFIDVAPKPPARVTSEAEGLPTIPRRQVSVVSVLEEEEQVVDSDLAPSMPHRTDQLENEVTPQLTTNCKECSSPDAVGKDETPSKPLRPMSEVDNTIDECA